MKVFLCTATRETEFLAVYPDDVNMDELDAMLQEHANDEFDVDCELPEIHKTNLGSARDVKRFMPATWDDTMLVYGKFLNEDLTVAQLKLAMENAENQLNLFEEKK